MEEQERAVARLAEFVDANQGRVVDRWKQLVVERLALRLDDSQLKNDLPGFVEDVARALRGSSTHWLDAGNAQRHGRHRMRAGVDMGALTQEMTLVGEAILSLLQEDGLELDLSDVLQLNRVLASGAAASVSAYSAMRDEEIGKEAARHFSFVAHELRTPLQSARLSAALLAADDRDQHRKHLARLDRSLAELTELVDDSLVHARLHGGPDVEVQRIPASRLVAAACDSSADHAEARSVEIRTDVGDFELDADPKLFVSALSNLVRNAVKFTREGSCVQLRARVEEGRALFEVEDECGGMPEDLPPRLFQPFVQGTGDRGGFGLGLLIAKRAVEAHAGSVRVVNRPGDGCTFVIDAPLRGAGAEATDGRIEPAPGPLPGPVPER